MRVNMKNEDLVKMFNPTLKMRKIILFFLIVVINGLFYSHCIIFIIIVFAPIESTD